MREDVEDDEDDGAGKKKPSAPEIDPPKVDHAFITRAVEDAFAGADFEVEGIAVADRPLGEQGSVPDNAVEWAFDLLEDKFHIKIPRSINKRPKTFGDLYDFIESQVRRKPKRQRH